MPKPRPTIASESVAMAREQQRAKEYSTKKKFVMKKFQNIEGVALKNFTKVGKGPGKSTTLSTEYPTTDDAWRDDRWWRLVAVVVVIKFKLVNV